MDKYSKLIDIQSDYVLHLIQSIKNVGIIYLDETIFTDDESIDKAIKNMIGKWQDDIVKLEHYFIKKEFKSDIPYSDILKESPLFPIK